MKNLKGILIALAVLAVVAFAWWALHQRAERTKAETRADSLTATTAAADSQRAAAQVERDLAKLDRDHALERANAAAGERDVLRRDLAVATGETDSLAKELERLEAAGENAGALTWPELYRRRTKELHQSEAVLANALVEIGQLRHADSASQRALKADSLQMGRDAARMAALEETVADLRKPGWRLAGIPLPDLSVGYGVTVARDSLMKGRIHAVDGPTASLSYTIHF